MALAVQRSCFLGCLFNGRAYLNPTKRPQVNMSPIGLSVKALAGPCRTEPTIVTEVGIRRITIFGTGFYSLIKSEVIAIKTFKSMRILHTPIRY